MTAGSARDPDIGPPVMLVTCLALTRKYQGTSVHVPFLETAADKAFGADDLFKTRMRVVCALERKPDPVTWIPNHWQFNRLDSVDSSGQRRTGLDSTRRPLTTLQL